jgi:amidophosphoribosyltransferase
VLAALRRIQGAFSLVMMSEREIIACAIHSAFVRWRSARLDGAWVLSSETCAFDLIHAKFEREIDPGEVVIIDEKGLRSDFPFNAEKRAFCMFEYVYFARPDSTINDINVAKVRIAMGRELARLHPSMPISSCPCPTPATTPRSVSPRNSASAITTRLSAIITSGAPFSSRRSSSAISTCA